jgi:hypothetical protein
MTWITHLKPVLPSVPFHRGREVFDGFVDPVVSSEVLVIGREYDLVLASPVSSYSIIGERIGRVEVEDEE